MGYTSCIYVLIDPVDNKVMYVGKTDNPDLRLYAHIATSKRYRRGKKAQWINQVLSRGFVPRMEVIETCEYSEWVKRERFWIDHYKSKNPELTNATMPNRVRPIVKKVSAPKRTPILAKREKVIAPPRLKDLKMKWRFANLLGEYQQRTGKVLSLKEISNETGILVFTLRRIANGKLKRPDEKTVTALLNYLSKKLQRELSTGDLWRFVPDQKVN